MFSSPVLLFIKCFFAIMVREWHGIDRLRLDKFYMVRGRARKEEGGLEYNWPGFLNCAKVHISLILCV